MESTVIFYCDGRGHVLTNLWLYIVGLPAVVVGFSTDEHVLGLLLVLGITGGKHGHHIRGWSQDAAGWVHAVYRSLAALPGPMV